MAATRSAEETGRSLAGMGMASTSEGGAPSLLHVEGPASLLVVLVPSSLTRCSTASGLDAFLKLRAGGCERFEGAEEEERCERCEAAAPPLFLLMFPRAAASVSLGLCAGAGAGTSM